MRCKKIAFMNSKGGVGKTTSVFHVAGVLSTLGEKVLIIDLDKQRDATYAFLMDVFSDDLGYTMFDFMKQLAEPEAIVRESRFKARGQTKPDYFNIDILPSDIRFEYQELLEGIEIKESLDEFIKRGKYTWLLVDMPPSNKAINDICFSQIVDYIIVPFSTDINSIRGYGGLIETVEKARIHNPGLTFVGVYFARYLKNRAIHRRIKEEMGAFGDLFIDVIIPDRIDIQESMTYGRPISYYIRSSPSKKAYEQLVEAIKKRLAELE